jgi:hypothetical protein
MNNGAKAEQLTQQADDLEEAIAKEFTEKSANVVMFQQGTSLDASREDLAIITVAQSLTNLGVIESANSLALTMFGFSKRDMLGKNISIIVPFPMNAVHDEYLAAFVASGHSVRCGSIRGSVLSQWLCNVIAGAAFLSAHCPCVSTSCLCSDGHEHHTHGVWKASCGLFVPAAAVCKADGGCIHWHHPTVALQGRVHSVHLSDEANRRCN